MKNIHSVLLQDYFLIIEIMHFYQCDHGPGVLHDLRRDEIRCC